MSRYIILITMLLSLTACGDNHNHGGHNHSHDAHVHGLVQMSVAIDNKLVEIGVESPAANFVGFERAAKTAQEIKQVEQAQALLKQAANMFSFDGAACNVQQVNVDFSSVTARKESDHDHNDKHHSDHGHKHDDEDRHVHEDEHADHHDKEAGDSHSDIKARYVFACGNAPALKSITVNLFDHFAGIEKINTLWVAPKGQGSNTLTAKNIKTKTINIK